MTDPERWIDGAAGQELLERELMSAGAEMSPPEGAVDVLWERLGASLGPGVGEVDFSPDAGSPVQPPDPGAGAGAAGTGTAAASGGVGSLPILKLLSPALVGVGIGLGAIGVVAVVEHDASSSRTSTVAQGTSAGGTARAVSTPREPFDQAPPNARSGVATRDPEVKPRTGGERVVVEASPERAMAFPETREASPERTDVNRAAEPPPAVSTPGAASVPVVVGSDTTPRRDNQLAREAAILARAKRLLDSGQPRSALSLLQVTERGAESGVLEDEREALTVEALQRAGQTGAAQERAQSFVKKRPKSPLRTRIEESVSSQ